MVSEGERGGGGGIRVGVDGDGDGVVGEGITREASARDGARDKVGEAASS